MSFEQVEFTMPDRQARWGAFPDVPFSMPGAFPGAMLETLLEAGR